MHTVNLIEEYDTWLAVLRFFKEQSKLTLCFTDPFRQNVCTFPHEKCCKQESVHGIGFCSMRGGHTDFPSTASCTCSKSTGEQCFPGTGWTMEKNTTRGRDLELLEDLGVEKRKSDHFLKRGDMIVEPTNFIKGYVDIDSKGISIREHCARR